MKQLILWIKNSLWSAYVGLNDLNANKDLIGLRELFVSNAETLAFILKDVVLRLGLEPERLRGQCCDGCSTMIGKKSGLVTTIKN